MQRYDPYLFENGSNVGMQKIENGNYALYSDAQREITALKAEIQRLNSTAYTLQKITDLKAENIRLKAEIKSWQREVATNTDWDRNNENPNF